MTTNTDSSERTRSEATKLEPFDNPVSQFFCTIIILLICLGFILTFRGFIFFGILMSFVGALMLAFGIIDHPTGEKKDEPRTGGLVTMWDAPLTHNGEHIVVGGKTILADYFPLYIGTIKINMSNEDLLFPMTIVTQEDEQMINGKPERLSLPLQGSVSLTLRVKKEDCLDFVQAGNSMKAVNEQLKEIVLTETQNLAKRDWSAHRIQTENKKFSEKVEEAVVAKYENGGSFGVEILKAQANFSIPEEILKEMIRTNREIYERKTQLLEHETNTIAAEELHSKDQARNGKLSYDDCLQEVKNQRLIKDKFVRRLEVTGGGRTIINPGEYFDDNDNHGGKKKGK